MGKSCMQEHAREEWPVIVNWKSDTHRPIWMAVTRWHNTEQICDFPQVVRVHTELEEERGGGYGDERPGHHGPAYSGIYVA